MTHTLVLIAGVATGIAAWLYMFVPSRKGIWPRTWSAATAMMVVSLIGLSVTNRLDDVLGPINAIEVILGVALGLAWLVATHIGYQVIVWVFPRFGDRVRELYSIGDGDAASVMVGPVIVMGIAEEFLFRGLLHGVGGFALGLGVYTLVQIAERNWTLVLAAVLCGAVWGAMFEWRTGLVAPVIAHVLWTGLLTFVWTLGDNEPKVEPRPRVRTTTPK